jgi:hypothetical protein
MTDVFGVDLPGIYLCHLLACTCIPRGSRLTTLSAQPFTVQVTYASIHGLAAPCIFYIDVSYMFLETCGTVPLCD